MADETATLCRMVLPDHGCPFDVRAKQMLEAAGAMLATSVADVATASRVDRPAAALGVPFAAWLGFAIPLAERVWQRNPPEGGGRT